MPSDQEITIEELCKAQELLFQEIETYQSNYKKRSKDKRTKGYIEGRISGIKDCWNKIVKNHRIINTKANESQRQYPYFIKETFSDIEEYYSNFLGDLNDALEKLTAPSSDSKCHENQSFLSDAEIKMPRIDIPKFSGSYSSWLSFRDLFESVIHKSTIPKVQKMYFLKTSLEGEAARLIRHLDVTEKNYD